MMKIFEKRVRQRCVCVFVGLCVCVLALNLLQRAVAVPQIEMELLEFTYAKLICSTTFA